MSREAYTVVIPAFNAAATIGAAIESVLAQTLPAERIVVIDDGSTDETARIATRHAPAAVVVAQANAGVCAATNRGIDAVETPLFACLDADDIWLPGKTERQVAFLAANPDVDAVFGRLRLFRDGEPPSATAPERPNWGRTTIMIRTAAARRIGPLVEFPASGGRGDVVDWISRGRDLGCRLVILEEVVALRRVLPGSMSYGHDERDRGYLVAVKNALDRRRKAARHPPPGAASPLCPPRQ